MDSYSSQPLDHQRPESDSRLEFGSSNRESFCRLAITPCLYPKGSEAYIGAEATQERAKAVIPRARYVHFATHAYLDELFPLIPV